MRLMKKDMGGAAHALALARLIIAEQLPVRLHLLIPAVENAVSGGAYRPGDIVKSRKGLFVEIDNTDAEGRLILADALTRAAEDKPELIVDFATLTGAARVALGPDLPALFANRRRSRRRLLEPPPRDVEDPLWRMPLWDPYDEMLKSDVADLANAGERADGRLHHRRVVPASASFPTTSPGPISTPMRGATRPSRGGPRAATRLACGPFLPCSKRRYLARLISARSGRNSRDFSGHGLQHFASLPV